MGGLNVVCNNAGVSFFADERPHSDTLISVNLVGIISREIPKLSNSSLKPMHACMQRKREANIYAYIFRFVSQIRLDGNRLRILCYIYDVLDLNVLFVK